MSGLNLVPNPAVIATQGVVFLCAYVIVKKFYVEPYKVLRAKRLAATLGSKEGASELLRSNEVKQEQIKSKIAAAIGEAQKLVESSKSQAQAKRLDLVSVAEQEADAQLQKLKQEMQQNLAQERAKIPQIVQSLSELTFGKLLS
jgi:F0F1-type ATP synthase membrane subunit b/b'